MDVVKQLSDISRSPIYWLTYIVGGLSLLVVALIYQYVFEELPCVVCIQIRLWFSLLVLLAIAGLMLRKWRGLNLFFQLSIVLSSVGLVERSYLLLGTEKGFVFGDCGFSTGLPEWFAIEQWLPGIYGVETSCGYTPEIIFGITMAEVLMLLSICMVIVSCAVLVASLSRDWSSR